MNGNLIGPCAFLAVLAFAFAGFLGSGASAQAQDQATLYHVLENTFGCGDPGATRALTDANDPRKSNSAWLKTTIANGRCVTITPRSPWKLVTQDNGVALMEYAGNTGAPGSYYIATFELVDPLGKHPDETPPPAATTSAPPPVTGNASETALAPNFPEAGATATATPHTGWSTWDVLLLLIAISIAGVVGYVVGRNTRD